MGVANHELNSWYDAGRFTDVTIVCGDREFKCHKMVLCTQSKFFEAACFNGFKVCLASPIYLVPLPPVLLSKSTDCLF